MNPLSYLKDREPSKSYKNLFKRNRESCFYEGTSSVLSNFRQYFRTSMAPVSYESKLDKIFILCE
jgi:hypothetical protein